MRMPRTGALVLVVFLSCGRPTGVPDPAPNNTQKLPFDRQPSSSGATPTDSFIPAVARIPEGTAFTMRLDKPLSSVYAQQGESFDGKLDDPIVVDGQTLIASGAVVQGRVLEAQRSAGPHQPGYLRIALISVKGGNTVPIETSAVFARGNDRPPSSVNAAAPAAFQSDVVFPTDRRLTFRLAQAVDLQ